MPCSTLVSSKHWSGHTVCAAATHCRGSIPLQHEPIKPNPMSVQQRCCKTLSERVHSRHCLYWCCGCTAGVTIFLIGVKLCETGFKVSNSLNRDGTPVHADELLPDVGQQHGCCGRAACGIECSAWGLQGCFADSTAAAPESVPCHASLPPLLLLLLPPPFAS
jgi:hypothetical protein